MHIYDGESCAVKVLLAELKGSGTYFAVKALKKDVVLEDNDIECTMLERRVLELGSQCPYLTYLHSSFQSPVTRSRHCLVWKFGVRLITPLSLFSICFLGLSFRQLDYPKMMDRFWCNFAGGGLCLAQGEVFYSSGDQGCFVDYVRSSAILFRCEIQVRKWSK